MTATDVAAGSAPSVLLDLPEQDGRILAGRGEPPVVVADGEGAVERLVEPAGPVEPGRVAVGLEQLEQPPGQIRVVLGKGVDAARPGGVSALQTAGRLIPHPRADETGAALRGSQMPRPRFRHALTQRGRHAEDPRRPGARGDHQSVPRGQHLVVARRPGPAGAGLEQPLPTAGQRFADCRRLQAGLLRDVGDRACGIEQVVAGEVAVRIERRIATGQHAEAALPDRRLGTQHVDDLVA